MVRKTVRLTIVAAASGAMAVNVAVIGGFTGGYAVHLCGWNALIQCDSGTRLFWLVPITVAALSGFAGYLLFLWGRRRVALVPAAALALWTLTLLPVILRLRPRTFGPSELIAAFLWGSGGIALLYGALAWIKPSRRLAARAFAAGLWVGFLATLIAMPGVLEHAKLH